MAIGPGDKCEGCGEDFFSYEGTMGECRNCGARFCGACFDKILKDKNSVCPKCGKTPRDRLSGGR